MEETHFEVLKNLITKSEQSTHALLISEIKNLTNILAGITREHTELKGRVDVLETDVADLKEKNAERTGAEVALEKANNTKIVWRTAAISILAGAVGFCIKTAFTVWTGIQ